MGKSNVLLVKSIIISACLFSVVLSAFGEAGSFSSIYAHLLNARSLRWDVRDAASEAATLDHYNSTADAQKHAQNADRLAREALANVERARAELATGIRNGQIGEALADILRRQLDQIERDVGAAVADLQANVAYQMPEVPDPEPPETDEKDHDPLMPNTYMELWQELESLRDQVKKTYDGLGDDYAYATAPQTLARSFQAAGVKWALRYTDSWGQWLYVDTWPTIKRHTRYSDAIESVLNRVKNGRYVENIYIRLLRRAMGRRQTAHWSNSTIGLTKTKTQCSRKRKTCRCSRS